VDITDLLVYGDGPEGDNEITVTADNSATPNTRWYSGGGIIRPVRLRVAGPVHVAAHGVRVTTISYEPAVIDVHTDIVGAFGNEPDESAFAVTVDIVRDGRTVAHGEGRDARITIGDAALWSVDEPNLYEARVTLTDATGNVLDKAHETFGIRMIEHNPHGLFINGRSVKLRGGCVHHDNGVLGARAYETAELRRVRIIKENGYNAIRCAHNPASEALLRACDRLGMFVIDEMWDMWYERKNKNDYALDFESNWKDDAAATTARDFNHSSVIMYSIGNENLEPYDKRGLDLEQRIVDEFHRLDPTRPVTMGLNLTLLYGASKGKGLYREDPGGKQKAGGSMLFNMLMAIGGALVQKAAGFGAVDRVVSPACDKLDIAGYNYASDRYRKDAQVHPDRLIYGSETMPFQLAANWRKVTSMDHVIGDFMWSAWDYIGEAGLGSWTTRPEGLGFNKAYPWLLAEAGAIDILGVPGAEAAHAAIIWGARKAIYLGVRPPVGPGQKLGKGMWRGTNAIDSWSWKGRDGWKTTIEVMAPAPAASAEVLINGKSIGRKKLKDMRALFPATYQPGRVTAVTFAADGSQIGSTSLSSAKNDVGPTLHAEPAEPGAHDGLVYVDLALRDAEGVIESGDDRSITLAVEGGELLGFGSADPCTTDRFTSGTYTTYQGRALAVIRRADPATPLRLTANDGQDTTELTL
ncbi:glycoside hydrolase family 2 TIM barrel-domain containing protein, partial [Bifidobacterium sp. SO4]|uniref:glycoside hydrolase family 2 TIM barrel-domain containing protein n=1 Tax=Bifidobacterium sp. SO4 TaxID=2809030 RepID=UPI001BDD8FFA